MRVRGRTVLVVGVAVASVLAIGGATASVPGRPGVIALALSESGDRLHVVAPDGSGDHRVANIFGSHVFGSWAPDGKRVAFVSRDGLYGDSLGVSNADGSGSRFIAAADIDAADWSPDGTVIAYAKGRSVGRAYVLQVWLVRPDGTGARVLGDGSNPRWSPDGRSIAARDRNRLVVFDVGTGEQRVVATAPGLVVAPDWSPDGTALVYGEATVGLQPRAIHLVGADGSRNQIVTTGYAATWSPDGGRLAVQRTFYRGGIDIVRADGTLLAQVAPVSGPAAPSWAPDGRQLAYATAGSPNAIVIATADGTTSREVASAAPRELFASPTWSPDGAHVLYSRLSSSGGRQVYTVSPADHAVVRLSPAGDGEEPAWAPDGATLVYSRAVVGATRLFISKADGRSSRAVTRGPKDSSPSWSPDGSQIVFSRKGILMLVRPDGTSLRRLHAGHNPTWSPLGGRIAFADGAGRLWTIRPDGTHMTRVPKIRSVVRATPIAWSPDARLLAAVFKDTSCVRGPCTGLGLIDTQGVPAGIDLSRIGNGSPFDRAMAADWSPDGSHLSVVMARGGSAARLVDLPLDGGPLVVLAPNLPEPSKPSWQPLCTTAGNDGANVLRGASADELICGRGGADLITGGAGIDRLFGGDGNDTIFARDRGFDIIGCGRGNDRVVADRKDRVGVDCERVSRR